MGAGFDGFAVGIFDDQAGCAIGLVGDGCRASVFFVVSFHGGSFQMWGAVQVLLFV